MGREKIQNEQVIKIGSFCEEIHSRLVRRWYIVGPRCSNQNLSWLSMWQCLNSEYNIRNHDLWAAFHILQRRLQHIQFLFCFSSWWRILQGQVLVCLNVVIGWSGYARLYWMEYFSPGIRKRKLYPLFSLWKRKTYPLFYLLIKSIPPSLTPTLPPLPLSRP